MASSGAPTTRSPQAGAVVARGDGRAWRWHISLSTWLRDYLYIPLGGSRSKAESRVSINLIITFLLGGLWHGAGWTFAVWGLGLAAVIAGAVLSLFAGFASPSFTFQF